MPEPGGFREVTGAVRRPAESPLRVAVAAEFLRPAVFARRPHQAEARRLLLKPAPPGIPTHHPLGRGVVEPGQIGRPGEDDAEHHPEHRQPERPEPSPDQRLAMLAGAAGRTEQFRIGVGEAAEAERPAAAAAGGGGLLRRMHAAEEGVVARKQSGYDLRRPVFRRRPDLFPFQRVPFRELLHRLNP